MKIKYSILSLFLLIAISSRAAYMLIPMDDSQTNHLKAYGLAYYALTKGVKVEWLLNYRGGSFMLQANKELESECLVRAIKYQIIADASHSSILNEISSPSINMDAIMLEKAPKIAVYSPKNKQPWDDAVTLALTYAEIPYDIIYDGEVIEGKLSEYDWLHMHHEDFTGQYGKFYNAYRGAEWYKQEVINNETVAAKYGFEKVSKLKLFVANKIKAYVLGGGYLFSMCSGTDSFDVALAAEGTDICAEMYDHDPQDPEMNKKLDFSQTFAFKDFKIIEDPNEYEYSNIDATEAHRRIRKENDYFALFDFSAKWDPVPSMLCQNHTSLVKGFMGQTTSFHKEFIKSNVLIMGEYKNLKEAKYIHGELGMGTWTFYAGHDPEDYEHRVGDEPTELDLYPNSPGYRLILNNVLFPAAKKKKQKT